eukprot:NODE_54_length_30443_cov_1.442954.p12 type:complete len:327 gc:universal NODE_54_length_30443_cov_1.442954:52-1032(+)
MKAQVSSEDVIQWLEANNSLDDTQPQIISNINLLVCMLLKHRFHHTSVGNYIYLLLSTSNLDSSVDKSIGMLLKSLSTNGGHYTVSNCIEQLEHFYLKRFFSDIDNELCESLLNSLSYFLKNHFHLFSLKFIQCIGILICDTLYSGLKSYYKLNNCILKVKSNECLYYTIKIALVLCDNGHIFFESVEPLESLKADLNEHNLAKCERSVALVDCVNQEIHVTEIDDTLEGRLIEMVNDLICHIGNPSFVKNRVLVYEIVEYINESVEKSQNEGVKRKVGQNEIDFASSVESKKIKLDLNQHENAAANEEADILLAKYDKGEFEIEI